MKWSPMNWSNHVMLIEKCLKKSIHVINECIYMKMRTFDTGSILTLFVCSSLEFSLKNLR